MARKLSTYVHVVETDKDGKALDGGRSGSFGPDDDLPDWAEKSITNPDAFEAADSAKTAKVAGK